MTTQGVVKKESDLPEGVDLNSGDVEGKPSRSDKKISITPCLSRLARYEGMVFSILAAVTIVIFGSMVKYLKDLNVAELNVYCNCLCAVFCLPNIVYVERSSPVINRKVCALWFFGGITAVTTGITRTAAFQMLPLGDASSIVFSTPFCTALFARVVLKERLTWLTIISLLMSLLGICLTFKLPLIFTSLEHFKYMTTQTHLIGCIYAVGSVLASSAFLIASRSLKGTSPHITTMVYSVSAGILSLAIAPAFGGLNKPSCGLLPGVAIVSLGLCAVSGNFCLLRALKKEDPTTMSTIYRSTDILLSFLIQLFIFNDVIDAYSASGALVIFSCGLLMPLQRWLQENARYKDTCLLR